MVDPLRKRTVAILIFDDVEVLDFCGPFEVFSITGVLEPPSPFFVYTVAENRNPVTARNGLSINPRHTLEDGPAPDILLIPGGLGTRREMHNRLLTDWIARRAEKAELVLSVCTGSLLLAQAGLLEGLEATTHHGAIDLLRETAPRTRISTEKRFIDNGKVIISGGISAGIDMSLYVVGRLLGEQEAWKTARYMEYDWRGRSF